MTYKIDGLIYQKMLENGLAMLKNSEEEINELNVFPVPDGDTGTNMRLTLENGVNNMTNDYDLTVASKKLSRGMLLGARGNSGVILSQLFKGQHLYFKDKYEVNAKEFVEALELGYKTAYNSVIKPAEGTILTVAREGANKIKNRISENTSFEEMFDILILETNISLLNTPNLLAILRDTGVVDSGGAGLLLIFKGMQKYLKNEIITSTTFTKISNYTNINYNISLFLKTKNIDGIKNIIKSIGTLISCEAIDNELYKIKAKTNNPDFIVDEAMKCGELLNANIEKNELAKPKKEICTIAVASGDGIINEFKQFGVDIVLNGGDKFNTSCEEFINAIDSIEAKDYIILPNNKNILLAAMQAKKLLNKDNIHIINTNSIAEGYFAISFTELNDSDIDIDTHIENMNEAINNVYTLEITRAIRDTDLNDIKIKSGEYIAILNGKIIEKSYDRDDLIYKSLDKIEDIEDKNILSIFVGKNVSEDETNTIIDNISDKYDNLSVGNINSNNEIYDFIIGIC